MPLNKDKKMPWDNKANYVFNNPSPLTGSITGPDGTIYRPTMGFTPEYKSIFGDKLYDDPILAKIDSRISYGSYERYRNREELTQKIDAKIKDYFLAFMKYTYFLPYTAAKWALDRYQDKPVLNKTLAGTFMAAVVGVSVGIAQSQKTHTATLETQTNFYYDKNGHVLLNSGSCVIVNLAGKPIGINGPQGVIKGEFAEANLELNRERSFNSRPSLKDCLPLVSIPAGQSNQPKTP